MTEEQKRFYRQMYRDKTQKDRDGKPMIMLHAAAPPKCFSCGLTDESIKKKFGGWTGLQMTDGVALYVCPRCHTVSGSPSIRDNIFMLRVAKEDREAEARRIVETAAAAEGGVAK